MGNTGRKAQAEGNKAQKPEIARLERLEQRVEKAQAEGRHGTRAESERQKQGDIRQWSRDIADLPGCTQSVVQINTEQERYRH